jgi:hypothetical protein
MNKSRLILASVLSIFILFIASTNMAEAQGLLDGKSYSGQNGEQGKGPDREDILYFKDGMFISESCHKYNFKSGKYKAWQEGPKTHFKAVTVSPSHGQLAWQGTLIDGKMSATFIWTKERWYWDIHREYWFEGIEETE